MVNPDLTASFREEELENKYIKINYPNGRVGFMMPDEIVKEDDELDQMSLKSSGVTPNL